MGKLCAATVFWLMAMALAVGEELPGETSGEAGDGHSGGGTLLSRDTACTGLTISLEGKVKAVLVYTIEFRSKTTF